MAMLRTLTVALMSLLATAVSAAVPTVSLEPAAPVTGMDPQGVLNTFEPRLPIGAAALIRVTDGDRVITISNEDEDVIALDETLGGGPEILVTDDLIEDYLLGLDRLNDDELEACDLNFDGDVDIADLITVLPYPGSQWHTGGDPIALIAAMPDGSGPLRDASVASAQVPRIILADGQFIDTIDVAVVENLMSLVPSRLAVRPGESFSIALQIDSQVNFSPTFGYSARVSWASQAVELGSVAGAADNEDFDAIPDYQFNGDTVTLGDIVTSRGDISEAVINVANIPFTLSPSAQPGTLIPFIFDTSVCSIQPQLGSPITPPTVKVLGCAIRVAR